MFVFRRRFAPSVLSKMPFTCPLAFIHLSYHFWARLLKKFGSLRVPMAMGHPNRPLVWPCFTLSLCVECIFSTADERAADMSCIAGLAALVRLCWNTSSDQSHLDGPDVLKQMYGFIFDADPECSIEQTFLISVIARRFAVCLVLKPPAPSLLRSIPVFSSNSCCSWLLGSDTPPAGLKYSGFWASPAPYSSPRPLSKRKRIHPRIMLWLSCYHNHSTKHLTCKQYYHQSSLITFFSKLSKCWKVCYCWWYLNIQPSTPPFPQGWTWAIITSDQLLLCNCLVCGSYPSRAWASFWLLHFLLCSQQYMCCCGQISQM